MRVKPSGEAAVFQAVPGVFDSRHPLECACSSEAERHLDKVDAAGAIPATRTTVVARHGARLALMREAKAVSRQTRLAVTMLCSSSGPGIWLLTPATRVRFPHTTRIVSASVRTIHKMTPSSNR
jgi:hypothetical protein